MMRYPDGADPEEKEYFDYIVEMLNADPETLKFGMSRERMDTPSVEHWRDILRIISKGPKSEAEADFTPDEIQRAKDRLPILEAEVARRLLLKGSAHGLH